MSVVFALPPAANQPIERFWRGHGGRNSIDLGIKDFGYGRVL